jgi:glycosyltransferase involved in cell wall biosynthesis
LPNARLVVIGNLDSARFDGVDGVEFVGRLRKDNPDELRRFVGWYRRADVLALASNYDPMPNITLEANLCGTPVVTTSVCGVKEQMREGVNGFLSDSSPAEFASRLKQVISRNGNLRPSSRHFVDSSFTWTAVVKKISELE